MKSLLSMAIAAAAACLPAGAHACPACGSGESAQAMTAIRDAETGRLRPAKAEEIAALVKAARAANSAASRQAGTGSTVMSSQPTLRAYPTGAHSTRMPASRMSYSVVTRQADGSLTRRCVQGDSALSSALQQAESVAATTAGSSSMAGTE